MELALNTKASRRKVSALNQLKKQVKLLSEEPEPESIKNNEGSEPESMKQNEGSKPESITK